MRGYWDDEAATRAAIDAAGWMHSGDLAVMDDDGYVQHRRPAEGHDHPRRREHLAARDRGVLQTHPAVGEAQVIGVPSAKYGEEVMAWVRLAPGAAADRGGAGGVLPGAAGGVQGAAATGSSSRRSR